MCEAKPRIHHKPTPRQVGSQPRHAVRVPAQGQGGGGGQQHRGEAELVQRHANRRLPQGGQVEVGLCEHEAAGGGRQPTQQALERPAPQSSTAAQQHVSAPASQSRVGARLAIRGGGGARGADTGGDRRWQSPKPRCLAACNPTATHLARMSRCRSQATTNPRSTGRRSDSALTSFTSSIVSPTNPCRSPLSLAEALGNTLRVLGGRGCEESDHSSSAGCRSSGSCLPAAPPPPGGSLLTWGCRAVARCPASRCRRPHRSPPRPACLRRPQEPLRHLVIARPDCRPYALLLALRCECS